MKKSILFLFSVCCGIHMYAHDDVKWLSKVFDFGAFDEDTKEKKAEFKFVNTSAEPISIVSASASCGCTVPKYDTAPVAPGDTATISVIYDPTGRPGRFSKHVYVRTSASPERYKLIIKGTVIGSAETIRGRYPVSLGPLKLRTSAAMMGRVIAGKEKVHYVDGYNQSTDTLRPVVVSAPAYLSVKPQPEAIAPGDLINLELRFSGDVGGSWGLVADSICIRPVQGGSAYYFPVTAIVEEDFSTLTPEQRANAPVATYDTDKVMLPDVPLNGTAPVSAEFTVSNSGKSDLLIRRVYSGDQGIEVECRTSKIKSGKSAPVKVTFCPKVQPSGIINARVTVVTNDPDNPMQVVRVVGRRK